MNGHFDAAQHGSLRFGNRFISYAGSELKETPRAVRVLFLTSFHSVALAAPLRLLLAYLCHSQECDASALVTLATLAALHKYEVRQQCRVRDLLTCLLPAACSLMCDSGQLAERHTHTHARTHTSVDRQAYKQTAVKAAQLTVLLHKFCGGC